MDAWTPRQTLLTVGADPPLPAGSTTTGHTAHRQARVIAETRVLTGLQPQPQWPPSTTPGSLPLIRYCFRTYGGARVVALDWIGCPDDVLGSAPASHLDKPPRDSDRREGSHVSPSPDQQSTLHRDSGTSMDGGVQDRVERFLASLTVEVMVLSKIGFSAIQQFYCLETACSFT